MPDKQESPGIAEARKRSYIFPSQNTAPPTGREAPPEPARQAAPIPDSAPRAPAVEEPGPGRPRGKVNWAVAGGIAVFAIVVVALLMSGLPRQNTVSSGSEAEASMIEVMQNDFAPSSSPAQSVQPQQLTQEQQAMLDALDQRLPEALPGFAETITNDPLFLAAAGRASYENPVFGDNSLDITLLLPDPRASSLDKLGIAAYEPYSGAKAYIRENYAKLRAMDTPDRIEVPVTLYYQTGIGGETTLDWSLMSVFWGLHEYSQSFTPNVEQYMADKGFHTVAVELLMPEIGGADQSAAHLREYFADLAAALSFKGVDVNGQTVVDGAKIEQILKTRLASTWVCDGVAIVNRDNSRPYTPYIHVRSLAPVTFFGRVYAGLDAQYKSGSLTPPPSLEEFEVVYVAAVQEMSKGVLAGSASKDQELIWDREYPFDWETLGEEGISACPELVEEIRSFLSSYDFDLLFTSHLFGYGIY